MKTEVGKYCFARLALVLVFVCAGCVSADGPNGAKKDSIVPEDPLTGESISPGKKWRAVYENDFSSYAVNQEPEDLFILDGSFSVQNVDKNKLLALPGDPLGDFGILFGPRIKGKPVELRCRMFSTRQGRRMPAFMAGLGGMNGFRFRIDCASGKVRLIRGEEMLAEAPYAWKSGTWLHLRFRVEPLEGTGTKVFGKVWADSDKEPLDWALFHDNKESFGGGKCVLWGIPYAGSEILFDDLQAFSFAE
ncbi:MAG: hypothetical protein VB980_04570 [Opitutales bacterium]